MNNLELSTVSFKMMPCILTVKKGEKQIENRNVKQYWLFHTLMTVSKRSVTDFLLSNDKISGSVDSPWKAQKKLC